MRLLLRNKYISIFVLKNVIQSHKTRNILKKQKKAKKYK